MRSLAGSGYAKFLRLRGRRVVLEGGVFWHSVGFGLYMSFPYHLRLDLSREEARDVTGSIGAAGIRYPSENPAGLESGLYTCRRRDYDVHALHRNFRQHIRQGLGHCEVRRVTEAELLTYGRAINLETMRRQRRYDPEFGDSRRWTRFVEAMRECDCIAPIGSFVRGRLASYAITCCENGWLSILHKMNSYAFEELHPSQVLDFTMTRGIATDPTIEAVSMGLYPLISSNPGLHEYKMRLGYVFERQYSIIRLHPALEWLASSAPIAATALLRKVWPDDQRLEMAETVMVGARKVRTDSALAKRTTFAGAHCPRR